eukprot:gene8983-12116_t
MFSALAESLIQKFCGKYLKHFTRENVSIGVAGTITITNVELNTDNFNRLPLPYKPIRAYVGTLIADLPLVLGSSFEIHIKDVLFVMENDELTHPQRINDQNLKDRIDYDSDALLAWLQLWIGAVYFSWDSSENFQTTSISGTDLQSNHKLIDQLVVILENIQIRIEEEFSSHITPQIPQSYVTGLMVEKLEIRPLLNHEITSVNDISVVNSTSSQYLSIHKMLKITNLSWYCGQEDFIGNISEDVWNLEFVQKSFFNRSSINIVDPISLSISLSIGLQKSTLVFGPIIVNFQTDKISININDEQLVYLTHVGQRLRENIYNMQSKARLALLSHTDEKSRRARMRWDLIRKSIKIDWWRYASMLKEGAMKWRAWFEIWRAAARYVAIRDILLWHVGYEAYKDQTTGIVSYAVCEKLLIDYECNVMNGAEETDGQPAHIFYQGKGLFSPNVLRATESLIRQQIALSSNYGIYESSNSSKSDKRTVSSNKYSSVLLTNPYALSAVAIRALYALQLELDTMLPIKVSAYCRVHSEDKYKCKRSLNKANGSEDNISNLNTTLPVPPQKSTLTVSPSTEGMAAMSLNNDMDRDSSSSLTTNECQNRDSQQSVANVIYKSLLVAVIDAVNIKGTFGSKRIVSYATLAAPIPWFGGKTVSKTKAIESTVHSATGTGFISWGEVFGLNIEKGLSNDQIITIEVMRDGLFSFSCGSIDISLPSFLSNGLSLKDIEVNENEFVGAYETTNHVLHHSSGVFSNGSEKSNESDLVSVRVMSTVVCGDETFYQAQLKKFKLKIAETVAERKQVLERQQKNAAVAKVSSEEDEDETFILDPSLLTVQDVKIIIRIPIISITVFGIGLSPTEHTHNNNNNSNKMLIPISRLYFGNIIASVTASNNPWIVKGQCSVDEFYIELVKEGLSEDNSNSSKLEKIFQLPKITGTFELTQISTMSRMIDGSLDISCFDFQWTANMFPFSIIVYPQSLSIGGISSGSSLAKGISIWKSYRPLEHLILPKQKWCKGYYTNHIEINGKPPHMKPEAAIRLGELFASFPKHLNVLNEMRASLIPSLFHQTSHANPSHDTTQDNNNNNQKTRYSCISPTRTMVIELTLDPLHSFNNNNDEKAHENNNKRNPSSSGTGNISSPATSSTLGFFDWFSTSTAPTPAHAIASSPVSASLNHSKSQDEHTWKEEKKALMLRLDELERKNQELEKKLNNPK